MPELASFSVSYLHRKKSVCPHFLCVKSGGKGKRDPADSLNAGVGGKVILFIHVEEEEVD